MTQHSRKHWEPFICKCLPSSSGIYIIWFDRSNRAYIGSSNNIRRRVRTHLYELETFSDHKMRADLECRGWGSLRAAVLELVEDMEELAGVETGWMQAYRHEGWSLYNVDKSGKTHRDRARWNL